MYKSSKNEDYVILCHDEHIYVPAWLSIYDGVSEYLKNLNLQFISVYKLYKKIYFS